MNTNNSENEDVTKRRKQRKIYNAYTDIDSVAEPPGLGFRNWIITTKKKLEEREVNLLSIRLDVIKAAIYNTVQEFNTNTINQEYGVNVDMKCVENVYKIINYDLIAVSINCLKIVLSDWNGIDLTRSTKKFSSFRKYFVVSKNWFDQRKKSVLAQHFWSTILNAVKEFSLDAAKQFFSGRCVSNQYEYSQYLLLKLIYAIFASKTQFSSTKPQPLIPGGTIKDTSRIKRFLENNVDGSLSIIKLIQQNGQNSEQETSATQTLQFILEQLKVLTVQYENHFHSNLSNLNKQVIINDKPLLLDDKPSYDSNDSSNYSNNSIENINNNNNNYNNNNSISNIAANIPKVEIPTNFPSMLAMNNNNNNNNEYNNSTNSCYCPYNNNANIINNNNNNNNNEYIVNNKSVINNIHFQRISNPFLPNVNSINHGEQNGNFNTMNTVNITSPTTMYNNNNNNNNNMNNYTNYNNNNMYNNMYNNNNNIIHDDNFNFVDYSNYTNYTTNNYSNYSNYSNYTNFGYGPVHHSSLSVSDNRHSPLQCNQFNGINNCHQCHDCNNCNIFN